MVINLMKNSSSEIVLNKNLSTSKSVDAVLKSDCSILYPVLILRDVNIGDCNYFQCFTLGNRYYYIDDIITREANILEIHGRVDVLMSFKTDILASTGIIERDETEYTKYLPDSKYSVLSYERIQTKVFPNSFPNNGNLILVVAGS